MAISTISLGKVKFNWRGDWVNGTSYAKDDVVKYGPNVYTCVTAHTSQANFADNNNDWDLMVAGLENAGVWNDSTLYKVGQTVTYGGAVYIALQESTNLNPYDNTDDWQKFLTGQEFQGTWDNSSSFKPGDIVRYGGYLYIATQNSVNETPTTPAFWNVYVKGSTTVGTWTNATTYNPGEVVTYGGNKYTVKEGNTPLNIKPDSNNDVYELTVAGINFRNEYDELQEYAPGDVVKFGGQLYKAKVTSVAGILPSIVDNWELLLEGMKWKSTYSAATTYEKGDVVEYAQSSYICIDNSVIAITPGTDALKWNLVAQGDSNAVLTTQGDIIIRDATQTTRLGIGPAGSVLTSNGNQPVWGHQAPQNDYYVSPQGDDTNDGRTATTSWRTIRYACDQTFNLGQVRINVSAGVYEEQTPIRVGRSVVLEGNGLGAVTISPNTTDDNGFGVGISDDGSTPNANSFVFHMNNGARMRNFVFRGFGTGSVLVSLDPGTGPDDTSVWITSQSPYVQNCTSFTPGGTGFKIDGALHNGGYKSMVANDWTQINSDGIGIHALNDGRSEIVSCFTYYCDIGYLAEGGAKIRAIVGNNSYGEYGAVARGFSQSEIPLTGNLQLNDTTINSITKLGTNVHVFTSYRDSIGNRFFVGHTDPTGTDVTSTFDNTASYPFVAKFNNAGGLDWIYTYESSFGAIHSAVELSDRIYCGGVIYDGANKGFILSISKAGEIQWQKTIGDTIEITDVATDENNLYAVGTHATDGAVALSLNPAGVERWSTTLEYVDGNNTLIPSSCCFAGAPTTSVDTYALAGDASAENNLYIASYDTTANQSIITRLNSLGTYVTTYQYGDIRINSLKLDTGNGDGIYLTAAGYYDAGAVNKNPLVFRISVDGTVQWQSQLSLGSEEGEYTDILPFGNDIYISGYVNNGTNTNNTGLLTRLVSTGTSVWTRKIDNSTNNISLNGIMLDGVNVIAAGIENGDSLIVNIERDLENGLGTITSGSYTLSPASETITANTVVTRVVNEITATEVTLGTIDEALSLNQSPTQTRSVSATRAGFAGIGTGVLFNVSNLDRQPKDGSVLQIDGDDETYFILGVDNFIDNGIGASTAQIQVEPAIPSNKIPSDNTPLVFREAFSQVRMSGHDFLDIGTGGFADTNYPVIIDSDYTQQPNQDRETLSEQGGRVFYVTTDQDGNFRVGDYFKVEQATGRATLSSEEFDLAGLNELQLGSITAGKTGATINEFSTDGTFADNSDSAVPTEKATKTYIDIQIEQAVGEADSIVAGDNPTQSKVLAATNTVHIDVAGTEVARYTDTEFAYKPGGTTSFEAGEQYMLIPKGDTANRPSTPAAGYLRYNTDTASFEGYNGSQWSGIGGGNPWISKTSADTNFTSANNDRIFINTSGGPVTINLPASPSIGDNVRFVDVRRNFETNSLTVGRNGENIMGLAEDFISDVDGSGFQLVYSGSTDGWILLEV